MVNGSLDQRGHTAAGSPHFLGEPSFEKYPLGEFYFPQEVSESFSQPAFQVCMLRLSGAMAAAGHTA